MTGLGVEAAVLRWGTWNAYEEEATVMRAVWGSGRQPTPVASDEGVSWTWVRVAGELQQCPGMD